MRHHLFSVIAIGILLLAMGCVLVDLKVALSLICLVLVAGIGLLIYRLIRHR